MFMINRRLQSMTDVKFFCTATWPFATYWGGDFAARREANIEGRLRGRKEANIEVNYVLNHFQINAFLRFLRKLKHTFDAYSLLHLRVRVTRDWCNTYYCYFLYE